MKEQSDIIILIPHFNDLEGLYKSLSSIVEEIPFDVLIVDDGSIEKPSLNYLSNRFNNIHKIHLIILEENRGIDNALNEGLNFIVGTTRYRFIARLDQSDTCIKNRFTIQYRYLINNPEVFLVGTWAFCTDHSGKVLYLFMHATDHEKIKRKMYFGNMFVHSSVMFRSDAINTVGFYPTNYKQAGDYAYFFKFVKNFKTANIGIPLVNYEINPQGMSLKNRNTQARNRISIILDNWENSVFALCGLLYNIVVYMTPVWILQKIKQWANLFDKD
jgi:glycosyltransferase involved in cell wall biosynthesis